MTDDVSEKEAFALQAIFGRAVPPVPDQGFSQAVMGQVRQRIRLRRLVLLPALLAGVVVALPAVSQLLLMLSNELLAIAARAERSATLGQFQMLLSFLPLREAAQVVSDEIMRVGADLGKVAWYRQNSTLILAGLMALVGLVASRILER